MEAERISTLNLFAELGKAKRESVTLQIVNPVSKELAKEKKDISLQVNKVMRKCGLVVNADSFGRSECGSIVSSEILEKFNKIEFQDRNMIYRPRVKPIPVVFWEPNADGVIEIRVDITDGNLINLRRTLAITYAEANAKLLGKGSKIVYKSLA
jgi:hypothetical protein